PRADGGRRAGDGDGAPSQRHPADAGAGGRDRPARRHRPAGRGAGAVRAGPVRGRDGGATTERRGWLSNELRINGEARQVDAATLIDLLHELAIDPGARGLAVVLNGTVARRSAWPETPIRAGDDVEI